MAPMAEAGPLLLDFARQHPEAFARRLAGGSVEQIVATLEGLPAERRVDILARLPGPGIEDVIEAVPNFGKAWLTPAPIDRISELLSRLPRSRRLALVDDVDNPDKRRRLLRQQQYPPHTIGSLIVDVPLRVVETAKTGDVVRAIRDLGSRDPGLLLVISAEGAYRGGLDPWPLLTDPEGARLADNVIRLKPLFPEIASVAEAHPWTRSQIACAKGGTRRDRRRVPAEGFRHQPVCRIRPPVRWHPRTPPRRPRAPMTLDRSLR